MSKPRVSIIILGYNRKDDIKEVLYHLYNQCYTNFETIVVDNNSTDSSCEMIKKNFPDVSLIRLSSNLGIPAYNKGFIRAEGDIIVVLNNDSYPADGAIDKIVYSFDKDESLGIIQGKIINAFNNTTFYPTSKEGKLEKAKVWSTFIVAGAAIRKELFGKIGYFPESVFLFGAELDFSLRTMAANYKISYSPDIIFYHLYKPEYLPSLVDPFYYHIRSYYWIVWRRYPFVKVIDGTLGLFFILFWRALRERKIFVWMKATIGAFLKLPVILKEREVIDYKHIQKYEKQDFGKIFLTQILKRKIK